MKIKYNDCQNKEHGWKYAVDEKGQPTDICYFSCDCENIDDCIIYIGPDSEEELEDEHCP